VKCRFLNSLVVSCFKPGVEHSQLASVLELVNKLRNRANMNGVQKLFDVDFITVEVQKSSQDFGSSIRVDFEEVDLDAFELLGGVEICSEFLDISMHVTKVD
jgi:hypothetical protein